MKWALLFGVTMLACAGLFIIAPFCGWWLPEGVSSHSWSIDFLFYVILGVTSFFFVLTEAILVYFMARYSAEPGQKPEKHEIPVFLKPFAGYLNDAHKIEMAWTVVPAAILLYIAFTQINTWANVKYQSRQQAILEGKTPMQVDVSARQFEWRMRYPSVARVKEWLDPANKNKEDVLNDARSFATAKQASDIHVVNEVHIWKDHPIVVHLTSKDVLHSFNIPHMRVKQDALPGKMIPVWFRPTKSNLDEEGKQDPDRIWEIPCAELCGWGHGRMIGRIYVHQTQESFVKWLEQAEKAEHTLPRKK